MEKQEVFPKQARLPTLGNALRMPLPTILIHPPSDSEEAATRLDFVSPIPRDESYPISIGGLEEVEWDFSLRKKPASRTKKLINSFNRLSIRGNTTDMAPDTMRKDDGGVTGQDSPQHPPSPELTSPTQVISADNPIGRGPRQHDFVFFNNPINMDEAAMLASSAQAFSMHPDPLPVHDKKALEARLNFHLCELDHLKIYINAINDKIFQTEHRTEMIALRATPDEMKSIEVMRELTRAQKILRNMGRPYVQYHRNEVDRIAEVRLQMNANEGLGWKMPEIFKNLPNDYEWAEMFLS